MNITPEVLEGEGYTLLDKLEHNELIPFIQTYSKKKTKASFAFTSLNILFLVALALLIGFNYSKGNITLSDVFLRPSLGLLIAFLLIPVHELIHALAYKYVGAKNTSFDAHWKKLYFMAVADKFVANRKEFIIVALAPFVVISSISILSSLFVSTPLIITFSATLLIHTGFCSGDFAMLSYFEFHKHKDLVTYDDKENKISYFYSKSAPLGKHIERSHS
ncbi:MAG: hypothetical protein ACJAS3_001580 [Roseivirga sp.]|jgi:hypothetical protein